MSTPPQAATNGASSQKRPLEEPSADSGINDQPDAKRQALGNADQKDSSKDGAPPVSPVYPDGTGANGDYATTAVVTDNDDEKTTNGNGDAGNVAATADDEEAPQPILSTAAGRAVTSTQPGPEQADESQWLHMRAIITSAEAATVIGKGGENVSTVRKMSNAKCTVSDYSRGAVERILTVSGRPDAIAKAFGLMIRTLNNEGLEEASSPQSKTYPLRLLIPHMLIGPIIGQRGARIREIQDASGARLNVSEQPMPLSTERSLVILGVADAIHIATYYVAQTLDEQLTERFGSPAASAYATRSGGPASVVPGGIQVVPYVPQPAGGQWGHPDAHRRHPQQHPAPPRGYSNPYGIPYAQGAYGHGSPQQAQQAQTPAPLHYNASSPGGYRGAGPQASNSAGAYGQAQAQAQQQAQYGQQPQQQARPMTHQPITQQIYIPNDMVGAIIGKGGAKINEIRQLSGSVIKINEPQDNSHERLVTITGTQECNQMALFMLYQRLESEKHRV